MSYEEDEKKELDSGVWFQSSLSGLWYKNHLAAGDISQVRIDGIRFKTGELEADLERVKAENRQLKGNQRQLERELSSLKSRLPVNEKGESVWFGDEVWWIGPTSRTEPASFTVANISYDKDKKSWRFNGGDDKVYLTSESCRASAEGGEG